MTITERNNKLKHFITCLKCEVSGKCCDDNCSTQYDAGNMGEIIENLEAISKALEQEPISETDIILTREEYGELVSSEYDNGYAKGYREALEQEPKTGHWVTKPHVYGATYCSECDFELKIDDTSFCPNCGAKMVDPQESEDQE